MILLPLPKPLDSWLLQDRITSRCMGWNFLGAWAQAGVNRKQRQMPGGKKKVFTKGGLPA